MNQNGGIHRAGFAVLCHRNGGLESPGILNRFAAVILKIMCYCHTAVLWNGWIDRPAPKLIDSAIVTIMENHSGTLNCVFSEENTLLVFDWDCRNLSVYHPSERIHRILKRIADSGGLFWRRSES